MFCACLFSLFGPQVGVLTDAAAERLDAPLHTRVSVLETSDQMLKVLLPNGKEAWVNYVDVDVDQKKAGKCKSVGARGGVHT